MNATQGLVNIELSNLLLAFVMILFVMILARLQRLGQVRALSMTLTASFTSLRGGPSS